MALTRAESFVVGLLSTLPLQLEALDPHQRLHSMKV
jgi:hypothetical protein